jgi:2-polyprenyl-3-methyl-5-hydroxy-6-metoxy-1,4-benzoquinol methylase
MKEQSRVKEYFKKAAKDFDDIYDNRGGPIKKLANMMFRKGMRERFELTLKFCGSGKKSVLDIGCGAGRFTIPLAEKGMDVVGIDYSSEMINLADKYVETRGQKKKKKALKIKHLCCDFLQDFDPSARFDVTLAIGVFDYLEAPLPFLKKMKEVTRGVTVTSFPARYTPQMPIRKMWLATKNCPVYFYTKKDIDELYTSAGFRNYEVIPIAAGYMVKAKA